MSYEQHNYSMSQVSCSNYRVSFPVVKTAIVADLMPSNDEVREWEPKPGKRIAWSRAFGVLGGAWFLAIVIKGFVRRVAHARFSDSGSALEYGLGGATAAMVLQSLALMLIRTIINAQYHHGTLTTRVTTKALFNKDGLRGYFKFSHCRIAHFPDAVANVGIVALLQNGIYMKNSHTLVKTVFASLAAAAFRMIWMPDDMFKPTMQTWRILGLRIRVEGCGALAAFYVWFGTYIYLGDVSSFPSLVLSALIALSIQIENSDVTTILCNTLGGTLVLLVLGGICTFVVSDVVSSLFVAGEKDENGTDNQSAIVQLEAINEIPKLVSNPDSKGKGRASTPGPTLLEFGDSSRFSLFHVYSVCGICGDAFQETHSPLSASLPPNSSKHLPFGLRLSCPNQHTYCFSCFSQYIISKLDPDGKGGAPDEQTVFPIRCPECLPGQWVGGVPDDVAERILPVDRMVLWHHRKLLDSLSLYYCPNRQCSTILQLDETDEPQSTCPLCKMVVCVPCKTQWHKGFTCEEYQALPPDIRSPEDRLLIKLAKEKKWCRCKDCGRIIERVSGCNRIICPCGTQLCFKCGADWDRIAYNCSRGADCGLWVNNDMFFGVDQRYGEALAQAPVDVMEEPVTKGLVARAALSWNQLCFRCLISSYFR